MLCCLRSGNSSILSISVVSSSTLRCSNSFIFTPNDLCWILHLLSLCSIRWLNDPGLVQRCLDIMQWRFLNVWIYCRVLNSHRIFMWLYINFLMFNRWISVYILDGWLRYLITFIYIYIWLKALTNESLACRIIL